MENNNFMRVEDVAKELGISKSYAYKIVQKLNADLRAAKNEKLSIYQNYLDKYQNNFDF